MLKLAPTANPSLAAAKLEQFNIFQRFRNASKSNFPVICWSLLWVFWCEVLHVVLHDVDPPQWQVPRPESQSEILGTQVAKHSFWKSQISKQQQQFHQWNGKLAATAAAQGTCSALGCHQWNRRSHQQFAEPQVAVEPPNSQELKGVRQKFYSSTVSFHTFQSTGVGMFPVFSLTFMCSRSATPMTTQPLIRDGALRGASTVDSYLLWATRIVFLWLGLQHVAAFRVIGFQSSPVQDL